MQETKRCSKCREFKPFTEFGKNKNWNDGYFPQCRQCKRAGDRAGHAKFKTERNAKASARYAADPEPQKKRANAQYRKDTVAKIAYAAAWQAANKDKVDGYKLKWYKANVQGAVRENTRRRAARIKGAQTVIFTHAQLEQRMVYYGNRCWICGAPRQAVDHVKPLMKGGAHMLCNLRPICTSCNSSKGDRWPFAI